MRFLWFPISIIFLILHGTPLKDLPAGIRNDGNYCYMASILQNIFHLALLRDAIKMAPSHSNQSELIALKNLVLQLETRRNDIVNLRHDFIPAFELSVQRHDLSIEPGNPDDSYMFYDWLVGYALPPEAYSILTCMVVSKSSFSGIIYNVQREIESILRINLVPNRKTSLEHWINGIQEELIDGVAISPTDQTVLNEQLQRAGVQFGQSVNSIHRTYELEQTGDILPILIVKNWWVQEACNTELSYPLTMRVRENFYELNGMVIYQGGHYYAQARDGGRRSGAWYILNDSSVKSLSPEKVMEQTKSVYMLFYVRGEKAKLK